MSNGRKRKDAQRVKYPRRSCTEGHCAKETRQHFQPFCRDFVLLTRNNKTPIVNCPYYKN